MIRANFEVVAAGSSFNLQQETNDEIGPGLCENAKFCGTARMAFQN